MFVISVEKSQMGEITRAKQHLIGKSGNVAACKKPPPNVVEELKEYMATKKSGTTYSTSGSGNMTNIRDFEFGEPIGCDGSEEDEFANCCNVAASAKTKCGTKKGPMDKVFGEQGREQVSIFHRDWIKGCFLAVL